jgi:ERCC4-type nuclease
MLSVDIHEPEKIFRLLEKLEVKFEKKLLPVGDFIDEEKGVIFERKTVSDFAGSIRSGHLFKQLLQQDVYENSYLVIVGKFGDLFFSSSIKGFTIECWLGSIASCAVRFKTKLLFVDNDTQAIKLICKIIEKTNDGKSIDIRDTELLRSKLSIDDLKLRIICSFQGVGQKRGKKLLLEPAIEKTVNELISLMEN